MVAARSLQVLPSSAATRGVRPRASLARVDRVACPRWPRGGGDAHLTLFLCRREQGFGRQSRDDSSSGIDGFRNRRREYCRGFLGTAWAARDGSAHRSRYSDKIPVFKSNPRAAPVLAWERLP